MFWMDTAEVVAVVAMERLARTEENPRASVRAGRERREMKRRQTKKIIAGDRSGIEVTYLPRESMLIMNGWYDDMVGIEGEMLTLAEFFQRLDIRAEDCVKAFAAPTADSSATASPPDAS